MEHTQLLPESQVLCHECGATGKEASYEQPHYLRNAHPWTSVTEENGRNIPR